MEPVDYCIKILQAATLVQADDMFRARYEVAREVPHEELPVVVQAVLVDDLLLQRLVAARRAAERVVARDAARRQDHAAASHNLDGRRPHSPRRVVEQIIDSGWCQPREGLIY